LVDTLGLLLSVYVTSADVQERAGARFLLAGLKPLVPEREPYKTSSYTPPPWENLEVSDARLCDLLVLVDGATTDAYGTRYVVTAHQRNTAGEVHDPPAVCRLKAVEGLAGLGNLGEILGLKVRKRRRGECFVYGDVYAAQPGILHPGERLELPPIIDNRDIHRLAYLFRFLLGSRDYRLGFLERNRFSCQGVASFLVVIVVRDTYGLGRLSQQPFLFVGSRLLACYRRTLFLTGRGPLLGLTRQVSPSLCSAGQKGIRA
jgi:hypothetical protein